MDKKKEDAHGPEIDQNETGLELPDQEESVSCIERNFPITKWLPNYKRSYLTSDLKCGLFLVFWHIPQGLAYVHLSGMPAYFGIYMAFFYELIIALFGGDRYTSIGAGSIPCLLAGEVVFNHLIVSPNKKKDWEHLNDQSYMYDDDLIPLMVALTFSTGILYLLFWVIKVSSVSSIFTPVFVSAFTTGASIHIICITIVDMLGLGFLPSPGLFNVYHTLRRIVLNARQINTTACIVSVVTVVSLLLSKYTIEPLLWKVSIPFPAEFFAVIIGTGTSYGMRLTEPKPTGYGEFGLHTIPLGLAIVTLPDWERFFYIFIHGMLLAFISFVITMELSQNVDTDHLLFAQGLANIVGGFFGCLPSSLSHHRNKIVEILGAKTPLAAAVCALLMLIPIYSCIDRLQTLPLAVLGSVEFVLNLRLVGSCLQLQQFWRESKKQAFLWVLMCLTTIIMNLTYGFVVGVLISMKWFFQAVESDRRKLDELKATELLNTEENSENIKAPEKK